MKNLKRAILIAIAAATIFAGCNSKSDDKKSTGDAGKTAEINSEAKTNELQKFPKFNGKDLDGNEVKETVFSNNKLNIVNFWFTGCKPCVEEMPYLGELAKKYKDKGVNIIGVCADAVDEKHINEAKEIMKNANADFTQISLKDETDDEMGKFLGDVIAFPTTYVVDDEGNILEGPIVGPINEGKNKEKIDSLINDHLEKNK